MFTGIIQKSLAVHSIDIFSDHHTIGVDFYVSDLLDGLEIGASVSVNGCCLTVTRICNSIVYFDVIFESLSLTNLSQLKVADFVHVERSLKANSELGGHLLSGHIFGQTQIINIETNKRFRLYLSLKEDFKIFVFYKGFIALDGASLTVSAVDKDFFCVDLIPETLNITQFKNKVIGDCINIEIDSITQTIVETTRHILPQLIHT